MPEMHGQYKISIERPDGICQKCDEGGPLVALARDDRV